MIETFGSPRILDLQLKAAIRQERKREKEIQAVADAKELLRVTEGVRQLKLENKEALARAKQWFKSGGIKKIFKAWKTYVKETILLRATARCKHLSVNMIDISRYSKCHMGIQLKYDTGTTC